MQSTAPQPVTKHLPRICLSIIGLLLAYPLHAAPVRFLVAYPTEANPPYYLDNGTEVPENNPGYSVEVIQAVGRKVKEIRLEITRCRFEQCLDKIRSGDIDALFNVPYRDKWMFTGKYPFTKAKVDPRQRLYGEEHAVYRIKDTRISTDGDRIYGLKDRSVAVKRNTPLLTHLEQKNYPVLLYPTNTEALQSMMRRDAPAAVLVAQHVEALARMHPELTELISRSEYPLLEEDLYLMISRQFYAKKPWLAEKIWEAQTEIVQQRGPALEEKYIR